MVSLEGFDPTAYEDSDELQPIPQGRYTAAIVAEEYKTTKKGDGKYLQLTLEILEGKYKGRRLFDFLNLKNPNATAQEIAKRTLSKICKCVGILKPKDSSELLNKVLVVTVKVDRQNDELRNSIKGYAKTTPSTPDDSGYSEKMEDEKPKPFDDADAPWS